MPLPRASGLLARALGGCLRRATHGERAWCRARPNRRQDAPRRRPRRRARPPWQRRESSQGPPSPRRNELDQRVRRERRLRLAPSRRVVPRRARFAFQALSERPRCHAPAPTRPRCGPQAWLRAGIAVPRSRRRSSVRSPLATSASRTSLHGATAGIIPASLMGHVPSPPPTRRIRGMRLTQKTPFAEGSRCFSAPPAPRSSARCLPAVAFPSRQTARGRHALRRG